MPRFKIVGYCSLKWRHAIRVYEDEKGFWYEIAGDFGVGGRFDTFDAAKKHALAVGKRLEEQYIKRFHCIGEEG